MQSSATGGVAGKLLPMQAPLYLVDAFADAPFSGNPAGVCLLDEPADESWMQAIAMEVNQAETAFIWPIEGGYSLKWFTPTVEINLCGHATLASAHIMWENGLLHPAQEAKFSTLSGWLTCSKTASAIEMDFPAEPAAPAEAPDALLSALGARVQSVYLSRLHYLVELADSTEVQSLSPDIAEIAQVPTRGVIVTAASSRDDCDFVSRYFAPRAGVPEDSVTGSAHCTLGPYWCERFGKPNLRGYQASRRGGYVDVHVRGERVTLKGRAHTTMRGELLC
jgi:PhzF family phenazine biosynthesis protein